MFSIDQNCHSLWDALPKLQALARAGHSVRHFVEDIDVAFTALGAHPDGPLRFQRERYHPSGGTDWGAAMFYSALLGRLPAEIRDWEPLTGMKTDVLARRLGRSVESLFDEFSPGDNWQLIGPSYVGDRRHHRVMGDLTVAETAPFLRQLLRTARADMLARFVDSAARARVTEWFAQEDGLLERLLAARAAGRLADLYRDWLGHYLGESVRLDVTSTLLTTDADGGRARPLEVFLQDYDLACGLYNQAVAETNSRLRPLNAAQGELPFFAVFRHQGHMVRAGASLGAGELLIADRAYPLSPDRRLPLEALRAGGVCCLAGKAIVLVIQVRHGPDARPLALPHGGSIYMPTARRLEELLRKAGLLTGQIHPVIRVRFGLLDRMRTLDTPIRLPEHLAACFGREVVPARELGENYVTLAAEASARLAALRDPAARLQWQRANLPDLCRQAEELDRRRRALAAGDPKSPQLRDLWKQAKARQVQLLEATLREIARDVQVADIGYWDSRGALLPWSLALGGRNFYNELVAGAEIRPEPPGGSPVR